MQENIKCGIFKVQLQQSSGSSATAGTATPPKTEKSTAMVANNIQEARKATERDRKGPRMVL